MADEELTSKHDGSEAQADPGEKNTGTDENPPEAPATHAEVSVTEAKVTTTEAEESRPSQPRVSSPEILDSELESVRPLPPSLRLKTALDATTRPMNVRTTLPSAQWPPKVVADVMTRKIVTVEEHEVVGHLEEWMQRFKFHHLPVVDSKMKFIGLISRTDFLHAQLGKKPDGTDGPKFDDSTKAGDIMRKNVVIAQLDSALSTACRVMLEKELTCIPVVMEDHTLVGILTKTDFVKLALLLLGAFK